MMYPFFRRFNTVDSLTPKEYQTLYFRQSDYIDKLFLKGEGGIKLRLEEVEKELALCKKLRYLTRMYD